MPATGTTDMGLGLTLLFGALTFAAAAYTYVAPSQEATAWGFAAAMVLAVLSVSALHVYGE
ncbi:MAG: hypothetical protein ABEJ68_05985 [Halobacteriaceae archaeon]